MDTRKSDTYHRLLEAAAQCFSENGFSGTSIGQIAKTAGVSQGAMYNHFKSKDDLILAIVIEESKTALTHYSAPAQGSSFDRLYGLIKRCINEVGYPANHQLWMEIIAEAARNNAVRSTFVSADMVMRQGIRQIIQQGIDNNEFNTTVDLNQITMILFSMIDGLIARKAINANFDLDTDIPAFPAILKGILNQS